MEQENVSRWVERMEEHKRRNHVIRQFTQAFNIDDRDDEESIAEQIRRESRMIPEHY